MYYSIFVYSLFNVYWGYYPQCFAITEDNKTEKAALYILNMYPGAYVKNFAYFVSQNGIYGSEGRKISNKQKKVNCLL